MAYKIIQMTLTSKVCNQIQIYGWSCYPHNLLGQHTQFDQNIYFYTWSIMRVEPLRLAARTLPELLPKCHQKSTRWQQQDDNTLPYYLVQKHIAEVLVPSYDHKCCHKVERKILALSALTNIYLRMKYKVLSLSITS